MEMKSQDMWSFVAGFFHEDHVVKAHPGCSRHYCVILKVPRGGIQGPMMSHARKLVWARGNLRGLPRGRGFHPRCLLSACYVPSAKGWQ